MRARFVMLFALLVVAMAVLPASAAVRTVLMEGFTQWNCPPCAAWNPLERAVIDAFGRDTVVCIKYHAWWPGANDDAFFLWNETENRARINYYGVNGVPDGYLDGALRVTRVQGTFRSQIRSRRINTAFCTIDINANIAGETSVSFQGVVRTESDSGITRNSPKLFVALISNRVTYSSSPGTNGETIFDNPFRDMWPTGSGQAISIAGGDSLEFSGTLTKAASWAASNLSVIVFVQETTGRLVRQAAWSPVYNLWGMETSSTDPRQMLVSPSAGEIEYYIILENIGMNDDVYDVNLTGTVTPGWTQMIEATGVPADPAHIQVPLAHGQQIVLTLSANTNGQAGVGNLAVRVTSPNDANWVVTEEFRLMAAPRVLLVDDDVNTDFNSYYLTALNTALPNELIGWWDLSADALDAAGLEDVPCIVWYTGSSGNGQTLSASDQSLLEIYLGGGGNLFLTGQGIAFDLRTSPFLAEQLHTEFVGPNVQGRDILGIAGEPIGDGLSFSIAGGDGANNQTRQSRITTYDNMATAILDYTNSSDGHAALRVEIGQQRIVFFAFGFEAISRATVRDDVMSRVVNWILQSSSAEPRAEVLPSAYDLGQNYPNPFNPETIVPYALPKRAHVDLRVYDVLGRTVAILANGVHEAGRYTTRWNAADVPSGVYFYRMEATGADRTYSATRKLLLMK